MPPKHRVDDSPEAASDLETPEEDAQTPKTQPKKDAFSVLMSTSSRTAAPTGASPPPKRPRGAFVGRGGLGIYLSNPASHPPSTVIVYTDFSVSIRDLYPKSLVHTLLLPRDLTKTHLSPLDAFDDAAFLASVRRDADELKKLVAAELRRTFGDQEGRDWGKEVVAGVHAKPSMSNLHVHVMGRDRMGAYMISKKHYLTFMRPFWCELDEFPMEAREKRRRAKKEEFEKGYYCWRCGASFVGSGWPRFRQHLDEEFEAWKKPGGGVKKAIEGGAEDKVKGELKKLPWTDFQKEEEVHAVDDGVDEEE